MTPDPLPELRKAMDAIRFAEIVREESRRTVLCSPTDVDRIRWWVDQSGYDDILTVVESPYVQAGRILLVDKQALDAYLNEAIQGMSRRMFGLSDPA